MHLVLRWILCNRIFVRYRTCCKTYLGGVQPNRVIKNLYGEHLISMICWHFKSWDDALSLAFVALRYVGLAWPFCSYFCYAKQILLVFRFPIRHTGKYNIKCTDYFLTKSVGSRLFTHNSQSKGGGVNKLHSAQQSEVAGYSLITGA